MDANPAQCPDFAWASTSGSTKPTSSEDQQLDALHEALMNCSQLSNIVHNVEHVATTDMPKVRRNLSYEKRQYIPACMFDNYATLYFGYKSMAFAFSQHEDITSYTLDKIDG